MGQGEVDGCSSFFDAVADVPVEVVLAVLERLTIADLTRAEAAHGRESGGPLPAPPPAAKDAASRRKCERRARVHERKRGDWRLFSQHSLRTLHRLSGGKLTRQANVDELTTTDAAADPVAAQEIVVKALLRWTISCDHHAALARLVRAPAPHGPLARTLVHGWFDEADHHHHDSDGGGGGRVLRRVQPLQWALKGAGARGGAVYRMLVEELRVAEVDLPRVPAGAKEDVALAQAVLARCTEDRHKVVNSLGPRGYTALEEACGKRRTKTIEFLLGELPRDYDCSYERSDGEEVALLLLDHGADVNQRIPETPLHRACLVASPSPPLVEPLLDRGAAPNATDDSRLTPLWYLLLRPANSAQASARKAAVARLLMARGGRLPTSSVGRGGGGGVVDANANALSQLLYWLHGDQRPGSSLGCRWPAREQWVTTLVECLIEHGALTSR
ncbi:ankyrin repeat-containing protein [Acanthamoeba castellanii str. Neff]|uniref:Ankyrin repeat-containing protein n=1 Tax=Acanthamoeba castellanii (strain ATCC 30010 / Neff) TaxID=1257118 RepID=L8GP98_ACACF|nr:ankyrin repeat-containing protein [Acanthamoeba castellanii str. Neff]ELR14717.1 ankyrin repeat-containing protein [Acanthamoeba castellanii str. Neff]